MPATQLATKSTPEDPLDVADAAQEAARTEAASVTSKIAELTRGGPGFDEIEHQRLLDAQEVALKKMRAADLEIEELRAAGTGPISARVLSKIRVMRRRVADLHPSLMSRSAEVNRLRAHLQDLRNSVEKIKDSAEYRHDQRELERVFRGDAGEHAVTTRSGKQLARLERDLAVTIAELELAQAAQAEAEATWRSAKTTLESWESAICAQGRAAARALAEIPVAGAYDDQNLQGRADISLSTPHALHQSQRSLGR